jgi:hypothetical protein
MFDDFGSFLDNIEPKDILIGVGGLALGGLATFGVCEWVHEEERKKHQEKERLYQSAIQKHDAEINDLWKQVNG